ncbi:protein sister of odd and bowel-like [Stegodyphus dumicola]|uniref:protein sister of odd and bowel-like n=1 Tax=Stegodyphus dumicola TaxID=202533 RepID=UPI0015B31602|nr:protein sister of odd and bowel-like [Stegodyphus dumicola]
MIYRCTYCPHFSNRKGNLKYHMRIHTGERPFSCRICSKGFRRNCDLRRHVITTHSEYILLWFTGFKSSDTSLKCITESCALGEIVYRCTYCPHFSTQKGNLKYHMRIHTGERPFSCRICSKTFRRNCDLQRHLITHAQNRNLEF